MRDKFGDKIRLLHIIDAGEKIKSYLGKNSKKNFEKDSQLQDACIRQLQVIGEACNRLSNDLQQKHPEIPWFQIIGLRNIVIHDYSGIDIEVIWNVIKTDLPLFLNKVKLISKTLPDDDFN